MNESENGPISEIFNEIEAAGERIDQLFHEIQVLKMSWVRKFLQDGREPSKLSESESAKFTSLILKAIEIQVRILNERKKTERGFSPLEVIWETMLKVPEMRALVSRESIRKRILEALDDEECEPGGQSTVQLQD